MPLFGSSEHWLARAKEARDMAEKITDADAKRAMLEIAADYEKVAKRVEAREAGLNFHCTRSTDHPFAGPRAVAHTNSLRHMDG